MNKINKEDIKKNAEEIANNILTLKRTLNEWNGITSYSYSVNYDYLLKLTGRKKNEPLDFEMMREILDVVIENICDIRMKLTLENLLKMKTYIPDTLGCRIKWGNADEKVKSGQTIISD